MVRRIDEAKSSTADILNSIEANAKAILEKVKDMKSQKITTDDYNTSLLAKAKKEIIGVNSKLSNVSGYSAKDENASMSKKTVVTENLDSERIKDFFDMQGWDTTDEDVLNYMDGVYDLLVNDEEFLNGYYTMEDWYEDTKFNYPEDIEWLNSTRDI